MELIRQERDELKKKNEELLEQLKSAALQVVEHERRLIQCVNQAEDVASDLDELQARIENYDEKEEDKRPSLMERMTSVRSQISSNNIHNSSYQQQQPKKNLPPEKAIAFAFKSLGCSIEYFEDERELLMSKLDTIKDEREKEKAEYESKIKEMEENISSLQDERETLNEMVETQEADVIRLQDVGDHVEEIEGERDALEEKCQGYQDEISILKSRSEEYEQQDSRRAEEDARRLEEDKEFNDQMSCLQSQVDESEEEKDALVKQCETQATIIANLKKGNKVNRFDEKFAEKANDFKALETQARLDDLQSDHNKLNAQLTFLERKNEELEQVRDSLQHLVKESKEEHNHLTTKIEGLEHALIIMAEESSGLKIQIQDLEDVKQMLEFKCQAQQDAIVSVKSGGSKEFCEIEDERERLAAKCTSLESRLLMMQVELASKTDQNIERILEGLNKQIAVLEEELEKARAESKQAARTIKESEQKPLNAWYLGEGSIKLAAKALKESEQ